MNLVFAGMVCWWLLYLWLIKRAFDNLRGLPCEQLACRIKVARLAACDASRLSTSTSLA